MKRSMLGLVALLITVAPALAGERDFITRPTRIKGCLAIVEEVKNGNIAPTQWLEENKEEFKDLELELKARKFPRDEAQRYMMGMAISICMERKGYVNTCVTGRGEDGDVQTMATAAVYACWKRNDRTEAPPAPPPSQPIPDPIPGPCPAMRCPEAYMTPPQAAQFQEDLALLSGPIQVYYGPVGSVVDRLASCREHWSDMVGSTPDRAAGWVRWSVRVRRCMYRTGWANRCPGFMLVQQQGWDQAVAEAQQPACYGRL